MTKFAALLIDARNKMNMTKANAANQLGWTPMYYGRYENGYLLPTKNNIHLFANFIKISVDELEEIVKEDREALKGN